MEDLHSKLKTRAEVSIMLTVLMIDVPMFSSLDLFSRMNNELDFDAREFHTFHSMPKALEITGETRKSCSAQRDFPAITSEKRGNYVTSSKILKSARFPRVHGLTGDNFA